MSFVASLYNSKRPALTRGQRPITVFGMRLFGDGNPRGSHGAERQRKRKNPPRGGFRTFMAPRVGFEPTTLRLTAECSAVELPRNVGGASRPQRKIELYRSAPGLQELFWSMMKIVLIGNQAAPSAGPPRFRHRSGPTPGIAPPLPSRRPGLRHRPPLPLRRPFAPDSSGGCGDCARNRGVWCSP